MRTETSDEALAEAAGQGDRAAFATLLDRHYDRLFRLCWRLTGSEATAEDLAQDICLKLPRALRSFRREARFTTWLYRIALNAVRDDARKAVTRAKALEGLAREPVAPPDDGEVKSRWLNQAMSRLKPDLAETVALIVGEELTQAEAAEALGIAPGSVAWRMSEAKKALKILAAEDGI
ncbi:MAG: RNA polymerase sigma factor [Pseudomonadota bacterium]